MLLDFHKLAVPLFVLMLAAASVQAREGAAALLRSGLPDEDAGLVTALSAALGRAGCAVTEIDLRALCDASALSPDRFDLLVLPDAGMLPAKAMPAIEGYLKGGGDIIALNAPMWQRALIDVGGRWITREECQREMAPRPPDHVLFDFASTGTSDWNRTSNDMAIPSSHEIIDAGPGRGQSSLHASIPKLTSWDTVSHDAGPTPFPKGHTLTVFSAKGGPNTNQLAIEWSEKDGSRWIAVVALTSELRQYILTPEDFRFWNSNPSRGFRGDRFKPENAERVCVGLAFTHTTAVGSGPHEYWIGPIGTAKVTPEQEEILAAFDPPQLDMLSPSYKLFDCHDVAKLEVRSDQAIVDPAELPLPRAIRSVQPRPTGGGFDKGRAWRWIPLVEARSAKGEWRGVPAAITVHADGPYKGGVWASFGVGDSDWYTSPAALKLIWQVARRMRNDVFLVDGGADFYTYFEGQEARLGARIANLGSQSADLWVDVTIARMGKYAGLRFGSSTAIAEPGKITVVGGNPVFREQPKDRSTITVELRRGNKLIDRVTHEINVWKPKEKKSFVTVKDGEFRLDGRRWRPHGVNYMPSSGIGAEDGEYFEHWIGAKAYDPEVIQRDLEHIKDLGFNSVSIFIYSGSTEAQNLLDILRRLDKLGLKANVSLRPGTPMDFLWPEIRKIIEYYKLWDNDTVFAYDLAWEPMFGTQAERRIWDRNWESWIVERYGSVENAEKDWTFAVPRDESGKVTNPLPHQIDTDGEWRVMTAAYRRFLDTLLYKKYAEARRLVRTIDPNHLVSFRMAEAANPNYRWDGRIPYDFPYLAGAVDFLAPEAYGRIGDWDRTKPGWFEREYARWAAPKKPMIWAEAGVSTWDTSRMANSPERLRYAAESYENFYKLLINSASDGVFFWWYPGGFRFGENTDFGVIEPDGTDREVSRVIRKYGPKFIKGPSLKPVNHWITIDRDLHPDGVAGIYDDAQAEFWSAIEAGEVPGLKTAGTGTDSCSSPAQPIGPIGPIGPMGPTPDKGGNGGIPKPLEYLDGAFDLVEVLAADGKWTRVENGGSIKVDRTKSVMARVTVTNLGESAWATKQECRIAVVAKGAGMVETALPGSVGHLESIKLDNVILSPSTALRTGAAMNLGPVEITLSFSAKGRGTFGERFKVTVAP